MAKNQVLIVHGMKRSGNHAIVGWLQAQGNYHFVNNIIPIGPIIAGVRENPPSEDFFSWLRREVPFRIRARLWLRRTSLIVSLEDHYPQVRPFTNLPAGAANLLILRDPENLFASRIRKASLVTMPAYPRQFDSVMQRAVSVWKSHAREFLGLTSNLENKICCYFDSWFGDPDYRQGFSRRLGLRFTDSGFSAVSTFGGGSSFDGTQFAGRNRLMNVLDRGNELTGTERELLQTVLADDELQNLQKQVMTLQ